MRQRKCPCCGNKIPSRFESSFSPPIPVTTNEEIVDLRQPKNSTSFETLVKVPLHQSGIYGLLWGLPTATVLSAVTDGNFFVIAPPTVFLFTAFSWTRLSNFFNGLLIPFKEIKKEADDDDKLPPVILNITDRKNNQILTGSISSDIATTEDIAEFAKVVKRDLSIARWNIQEVSLTQTKFTKKPNKIFSQPKWTEFIEYLESMKLVERKGNSKNSTYILTRTGLDFIHKYSKLEL